MARSQSGRWYAPAACAHAERKQLSALRERAFIDTSTRIRAQLRSPSLRLSAAERAIASVSLIAFDESTTCERRGAPPLRSASIRSAAPSAEYPSVECAAERGWASG